MPDIENLRKQAKRILRWHQMREYTLAEQIRLHMPRFAQMSDREILDAGFKLADAQEMLARKEGFESWAALKAGLEPMANAAPEQQTAQQETEQTIYLASARPHIFVRDVNETCEYYRRVLGFRTMAKYGDPPFFASISRDAAWIEVRCVEEDGILDPALRAREDMLSATINLMSFFNLKKLYAEYEAAGADFHQPLKKQPWGGHDFIVRDPDGNLIDFGCAG